MSFWFVAWIFQRQKNTDQCKYFVLLVPSLRTRKIQHQSFMDHFVHQSTFQTVISECKVQGNSTTDKKIYKNPTQSRSVPSDDTKAKYRQTL
ncbi:Uncharacterized protein XB16_2027 [Leptospira santarosai]|uniref:Uncharacterized protein n=1 Tax=Leptospira santarosai TaxID=28183 RepID=A0A2P1QTY4_9LEPT|nr:Uncharacterized protein XB16_2027 [Leptospira santarosai]